MHALKHARPRLKITWLVNVEWAPLLQGNADLDEVITFPRNDFRGVRGLLRLYQWSRSVKHTQFDLALDFQGLTRSALLARVAGAKRVHCLGDAEILPRILAHRVVPADRESEHAVERYLRLVADLGVIIEKPLQFPLPAGEMPRDFQIDEPFLLLHPFSRGADKSLAKADVERLCELLAPIRIVLAGRSEIKLTPQKNCIDLLNKTSLVELIRLIRRAHFVVSVDSGPMHIASAITPKLLGIHTWTNPRIVGPYQPDAFVWKNAQIKRVSELPMETAANWAPFRSQHLPALAEFVRAQF